MFSVFERYITYPYHCNGKVIIYGILLLITEETTSSSETSPTDARKSMPPSLRKSKSKNQFLGKRMTKTNNGYSNHTEETTFRWEDNTKICIT